MTINQILKDNPHFGDYEITLSQYFAVPTDKEGDLTVVTDFPVLGLASADDTKELRFVIEAANLDLIRNANNLVIHMVDQKLAAEREKTSKPKLKGEL